MAGSGVSIDSQLSQVKGNHSQGLGPVDETKNAPAVRQLRELLDGSNRAGHSVTVSQTDDLGSGCDGRVKRLLDLFRTSGRRADRHLCYNNAVTPCLELPRPAIAVVFQVTDQNFVAILEIEPFADKIIPLGGVAKDGNLFGGRADKASQLPSDHL